MSLWERLHLPAVWMSEWVCLRLLPSVSGRSSSYCFHSFLPTPPQNIGSALTLLNQSGIFNCACFWVSFASAHSTHVQSRRHSSAGNTLTSTLMEYYCFLLLWICWQHMGEWKVFMSHVILGFVSVCLCVSVCTCARVAMCVCRCACWPWSVFIQHCSVGIL